jgi:hypothetical protein
MQQHFEPGRYWAVVTINGRRDENAIIGRDAAMATYFFQSGEEDLATDEPIVWLGRLYSEHPDFPSLITAMERAGVEIIEWELQR